MFGMQGLGAYLLNPRRDVFQQLNPLQGGAFGQHYASDQQQQQQSAPPPEEQEHETRDRDDPNSPYYNPFPEGSQAARDWDIENEKAIARERAAAQNRRPAPTDPSIDHLQEAHRRLDEYSDKRRALTDDFYNGRISPEEYDRQMAALNEEYRDVIERGAQ